MASALLQFFVSAAIVATAGTVLTRYADEIAEITGFGRLLVGSVLLAAATSLPELTVDISAVRAGIPNLAIGDLLGSSLMNLLILASMDFSSYTRGKMLSREAAGHALSGTMSISLTALVGLGIATGTAAENWTIAGVSVISLFVLTAYCLGVRLVFLDQRIAARAAEQAVAENPEAARSKSPHLGKALGFFSLAAVVIVLTGPVLSHSADQIAKASGLGHTFVGTVLVAFTTSLPEIASSYAAVRMGAYDLAIGNIFGSNTFNMILFVPLDMFHSGSLYAEANPTHIISALAAIVATTVVIQGQLYRAESRIRLIDPDAWLVVLVVIGALYFVYRFA